MIGTVTEADQGGFDLALPKGGFRRVTLSEIERLEQSFGTRTYKMRGVLISAGWGLAYAILSGNDDPYWGIGL